MFEGWLLGIPELVVKKVRLYQISFSLFRWEMKHTAVKKLTGILCLSDGFVQGILSVVLSWCKAWLSDAFPQLWRNLCRFVHNRYNYEHLQYGNRTVFKTKMSSSRQKARLFELVKPSAELWTENIRERWRRGRTLNCKAISLSSLNFDIQLCFAAVQSNFRNSAVFRMHLQGKYLCHFHRGCTCKLISLGFS